MLKPYNIADVAFQLGQEIGAEGKNSNVYIAHDPQLDAQLVIKKCPKAKMDAAAYFAESSCVYASSHSNVVPIYYACQDPDSIYLAMPYYVNGSLKKLMEVRFLTVREIVIFATQFLSGLHHIHSQKLVHFDIKPDNILLSDRGEALIADFGLAKARGINGLAEQDRLYGKMAPPEAYQAGVYDHRFDIYQVGLTLFRMCVGDAEFYAQYESHMVNGVFDKHTFKHAVINGQFPSAVGDVFPEHIPEALIKVVRKCLLDIDQRYPSVIDIVNDLAAIEGEQLDWKYSHDQAGKHWVKQVDDMIYSLDLDPNRVSIAKKGKAEGPQRRINDYCTNELNRKSTKKFLREN
ncbi:serine/threonine protein kinase [Pseudoxanthomonas yeongjuensis]|uniref:serine/threonine-protein kinase n=1 Tax=Pseudoxanthomonas yeongjuensis TaxID=377616 RepID=UPI001390F449|nr:serine/threonine-protein kinase [Pseudoxanthomonas yeongjuensis]KAF1717099.1 serine/threonine protein kinase [Pseudoxanthomonas yeongjuensis]